MERQVHMCGGTILVGGAWLQRHLYCERCAAFTYGKVVPSGTDERANRSAWNAGDDASPDGGADECVTCGGRFDATPDDETPICPRCR